MACSCCSELLGGSMCEGDDVYEVLDGCWHEDQPWKTIERLCPIRESSSWVIGREDDGSEFGSEGRGGEGCDSVTIDGE